MNASSLTIGTKVFGIGLYGENGDKTHATTGEVVLNEAGVRSFSLNLVGFSCDGNYNHQGNGGLFRATNGVICTADDSDRAAKLDAAITCDNCRARLGLAPVFKSTAAQNTIAAKKQAAKDAKVAAAKATAAQIEAARVAALPARIVELTAKLTAAEQFATLTPAQIEVARRAKFIASFPHYTPEKQAEILAGEVTANDVDRANDDLKRNAQQIKMLKNEIKKAQKEVAAL